MVGDGVVAEVERGGDFRMGHSPCRPADRHQLATDAGGEFGIIELFRDRFPISFGYIECDHRRTIRHGSNKYITYNGRFRKLDAEKYMITDEVPGGFFDRFDGGVQTALYAAQARADGVKINAIQVFNESFDATATILNYYQTTCGWYHFIPPDGTGIADAVIWMLYAPGPCCP